MFDSAVIRYSHSDDTSNEESKERSEDSDSEDESESSDSEDESEDSDSEDESEDDETGDGRVRPPGNRPPRPRN